MRCDLCNEQKFKTLHRKVDDSALGVPGEFNIVQCQCCSLVFLYPRPTRAQVSNYYTGDYVPYKKQKLFFSLLRKTLLVKEKRLVRALLGKRGDILEIGPARGDFLHFLRNGYGLYGLEMDERCIAEAEQHFGLRFWKGRLENFTFPTDVQFDLVIMRFVLEHLESPRDALLKIRDILAPGGFLFISVPNYGSWERSIFGRFWHGFDVPRHFFIFSKSTDKNYAARLGFKIVLIKYSFVPNDLIGSIQRLLRKRGYRALASFFNYRNPILILLFLPVSVIGFLLKRSSRLSFILQVVDP